MHRGLEIMNEIMLKIMKFVIHQGLSLKKNQIVMSQISKIGMFSQAERASYFCLVGLICDFVSN